MNKQLLFVLIGCALVTLFVLINKSVESPSRKKRKAIPLHLLRPKKKTGDRLYCMIPYMWTKAHKKNYKERYDEIMHTWGQRCDLIRFFVDPVGVDLPSNVFEVPMRRKPFDIICSDGRPCKHIWEKVWRAWVWVYNNEIDKAEWFVKVDDDTYLFPENILSFIKQKEWDYSDTHYFGHKLYHTKPPIIAGTMVGFSKETLQQVVPVYNRMPYEDDFEHGTCADVHGQTEETTTSICLWDKLSIPAEETVDATGKEHVLIAPPHYSLRWRRDITWYWEKKPMYLRDRLDCCSFAPMAFHGYKKIGTQRQLESIFYYNSSLLNWDDRKERNYFKHVRTHLHHHYLDDSH